jgi:hypothetical protein
MSDLKKLAYEFFDKLKAGQVIAIKEIAKKDQEAFKQYIRDYIDDGGLLTVSPDWKKFRKDDGGSGFVDKNQHDWYFEHTQK